MMAALYSTSPIASFCITTFLHQYRPSCISISVMYKVAVKPFYEHVEKPVLVSKACSTVVGSITAKAVPNVAAGMVV